MEHPKSSIKFVLLQISRLTHFSSFQLLFMSYVLITLLDSSQLSISLFSLSSRSSSSANMAFEFSIQFYFTYCCQSTVCLKQSCREIKKDSVLGVFISWVTLLFYFSLASFRLLTKKLTYYWVRKKKGMRHCMGLRRYTMNCCANRNSSGR